MARREEYQSEPRSIRQSGKAFRQARREERREIKRARKAASYFDYNLMIGIFFLLAYGLIILYSASSYIGQVENGDDMFYFKSQAVFVVIGLVACFLVSRFDYHFFGKCSVLIFIVSLVSMALVRTSLGVESFGARRWLQLPGGHTFQPSELAKFAVILFISLLFSKLGENASFGRSVPILFLGIVLAVFVYYFTDNLSTAIIVLGILFSMYFIMSRSTVPFILLLMIGLAFVVFAHRALYVYVETLTVDDLAKMPFRIRRILVWVAPQLFPDDGGMQVTQGLYAVGAGGFFGKGLGNSAQKLGHIPEIQNDMIFAVVCEELGIFGVILMLALFTFIIYRMVVIARNAPDLYGALIVTGVIAHISLQVILNLSVVLNLIPTTGISLPFFSYGGTSMLFTLAEIGLVLSVSKRIRLKGREEDFTEEIIREEDFTVEYL